MCGVIGIINTKDVVGDIYLGLLCLQHRGQDSAGISTFDASTNQLLTKKAPGLVQEIFSCEQLKKLKGNVGIGHTRYPTVGSDVETDTQPFVMNSGKKIAMGHNGNLTNYYELKEKLRLQGVLLDSTCDVEPVLHIFANEFERTHNIFSSVNKVYQNIAGSYSVVALVEDGLLAFRDPKGIRPLVMGRKKDSYIICSETAALDSLGYSFMREVLPGEAIFIDKDFHVSSKILRHDSCAHCMFEWVYFSRADSVIEKRTVYNARLELGKRLAKRFDKEVDVIIPVPDSARTAAIAFAEELRVPYREGFIKNRYIGRTFIMDSQEKRDNLINLKLNPVSSTLRDLRVAVVDDSIVRSTTSQRIVKILKAAKAKEIHFVSTCPPIKYPCFYGIDFATRGELIASNKTIEEIREHIGADSLTYMNIEDLKVSIRKEELCTACLTGYYPTKISCQQKELISDNRLSERLQNKKLKVAIIGSGGREHVLGWKIKQSSLVEKIYAIPGNAGLAEFAECVDLNTSDTSAMIDFIKDNDIDLTVVGPELPLAAGIVDEFEKHNLKIFGPNKAASRLEGSKIFAKEFMKRYGLPTADFRTFDNHNLAVEYIRTRPNPVFPIVIKADGLAAGKGVIIAKNENEALDALNKCMLDRNFGDAGSSIVIEDFLEGEELSYMLLLDGKTCKEMASSQDHKAVFDEDKGPNTGGMGAYSPAPVMKGNELEIREKILQPLLAGLREEGLNYKGVLYLGLIKTSSGFKILEFNCRFGDPETQVLLPRLKTDLVKVFYGVVEGNLNDIQLEWSEDTAVGIVLAASGYPGKYEKGEPIYGLDQKLNQGIVFHAGTKKEDGQFFTHGGRVLCVTTLAAGIEETIRNSYANVQKIRFNNMHYRSDIGKKALKYDI